MVDIVLVIIVVVGVVVCRDGNRFGVGIHIAVLAPFVGFEGCNFDSPPLVFVTVRIGIVNYFGSCASLNVSGESS